MPAYQLLQISPSRQIRPECPAARVVSLTSFARETIHFLQPHYYDDSILLFVLNTVVSVVLFACSESLCRRLVKTTVMFGCRRREESGERRAEGKRQSIPN